MIIYQKQKKLNIVLDNYSVHHSAYIKQVTEILNINLIFLPAYSPDLNPIEDVWPIIKKYVSNKFIKKWKKHSKSLYIQIL
jgi:transposase